MPKACAVWTEPTSPALIDYRIFSGRRLTAEPAATDMTDSKDSLVKLLFSKQNTQAKAVRLTQAWQQMKASLEAPAPVLTMLGELAAAAALWPPA